MSCGYIDDYRQWQQLRARDPVIRNSQAGQRGLANYSALCGLIGGQ